MPHNRTLHQASRAELCQRLVLENYAPATVLINRKCECLYSLGATDRYLRVAPGLPSHDLFAVAREGIRGDLRTAIDQACRDDTRVVVTGLRADQEGQSAPFSIVVQPLLHEGEVLLLVCFVDQQEQRSDGVVARMAELERELATTRTELQTAIRDLETSAEEQRVINETSYSVNAACQSDNTQLLASAEQLQSLNDELNALNDQLHETLEHRRIASDDLQNVLYSTDVATIFLDTDLRIRLFTPATKSLFSIIPSDIGRPLEDLKALSADSSLPGDAHTVMRDTTPIEREIEGQNGVWFVRRILPYRTHDNRADGVVITFTDISGRKRIAKALEEATRQAELANVAKSRFLAAASHDLRQPLQTLALLQGLLARAVEGERPRKLVQRLDETLGAMSGMLNTLLDINQIEAGTVRPDIASFPVSELLERMRDEFTYHAQAQRLALRVIPCGLRISSDVRLLEQILRNLLANAFKYTKHGKVLVGCRRHHDVLSIEIWDTGVGIPHLEQEAIFEAYHQLDNAARERSRGLGLGLSIVRSLSNLLGHRVRVRSHPGQGSVFSIQVPLSMDDAAPQPALEPHAVNGGVDDGLQHSGTILVIEDDPELRELLDLYLRDEGHRTVTAPDGRAALELVTRGTVRPHLILADYNLPQGMNGLQVIEKLWEVLQNRIPAIILTGDISTETLREIARRNCEQINKPAKLKELSQAIQRLLVVPPPAHPLPTRQPTDDADEPPVVFIVDDDSNIRETLREVLEEDGRKVEDYAACEDFLAAYRPRRAACLLVDANLPGMSGLALLQRLTDTGRSLPAVMITGGGDVPMAVKAMKAGAADFIEKPVGRDELLACVARALEQSRDAGKLTAWRETAANHMASLTPRQCQIMKMVLAGHPSKNIAADLGISQRTVENHRASIMKKTGSSSMPALARLAFAANWDSTDETTV